MPSSYATIHFHSIEVSSRPPAPNHEIRKSLDLCNNYYVRLTANCSATRQRGDLEAAYSCMACQTYRCMTAAHGQHACTIALDAISRLQEFVTHELPYHPAQGTRSAMRA